MKAFDRSTLTALKRFGACLAVGALAVGTLPATTALTQGDSPLPTPPPPPATAVPTALPTPPPAPEPAPTSASGSSRLLTQPKLITKRIQETDATAPYEIDVQYPAVDSAAEPWTTFNTIAEIQAQEMISAFKKDVAAMGTVSLTVLPTNTLSATWESFRVTRDFVSVRSTVGVYMAGAAHPNTFSRVINFDPRTGKDLALADLFRQTNADYLGTLSSYCKRILQRRDVLDFPDGADPKSDNYANWNMGRFNLVISFDPYLVAPYAAGRQECQMPLRTLRRLFAEPRRW